MGNEILHTKRVDLHVHILGNGLSGSGCRVSMRWWQRPFIEMMARDVGIDIAPDDPALDNVYVDRLLRWVQESSLEKVVILACDDLFDELGTRHPGLSGIYVPNDRVLELARAHSEFLAGVSIHPARKDAIAELERCVAAGAVLLKLLPCVQAVDCNREAYRPFWQRLAELCIPFLAHTGGEFSLPTHRPDLRSPEMLRLPLECGVNVVAAHCGTRALPWHPDYFEEFEAMRRSFPNLYGDIAALSQPLHLRTLEKLRENPERILYGSDYPVVTSVFWSLAKGWINRSVYHQLRAIRNPLERKYQLTKALGFPDNIFTDVWKILRIPRQVRQHAL
jgi:predicted TIM-barrel fold metal-dependent hydrolase